MTKEDFKDLGLDDEVAEKCAKASEKELAGFVPKAKLDIAEQAKETLELQVKENTKQLNMLKKSAGDTEKLTQTIAELQASNKQAKVDYEKKLQSLRIDYAINAALDDAKAKNKTAVRALLDTGSIEIDENGKVKGLDKQIKKLAEAEDTAFLFEKDGKPNPKDGKPKIPKEGEETHEGNEGNKPSIGADFAKAYNNMMNPSNDNGKEG